MPVYLHADTSVWMCGVLEYNNLRDRGARNALCLGVSFSRSEEEKKEGRVEKLKHSPAQRKTALRSCGLR